ncbi:MAG: hypothetical protein ABSC57_10335 [Syntrophales bacterium]
MITVTRNKFILSIILTLICICFLPKAVDAQVIKTSVSDILSNPDKYDGKVVQVQGRIQLLKFNTSKKGKPYTTFMVVDPSNSILNVFSFGTLSVSRGDKVTVTGRYQKVKHVPPKYTFYNEIETTEDGVRKKGEY